MSVQNLIQYYQLDIEEHERATEHHGYTIYGTNKKEKTRGVYCLDCKRFITTVVIR